MKCPHCGKKAIAQLTRVYCGTKDCKNYDEQFAKEREKATNVDINTGNDDDDDIADWFYGIGNDYY